jgi:hypothetical protein
MLAQQASRSDVGGCNFHIQEESMHKMMNFFRAGSTELAESTNLVGQDDLPKSAKPTA